MSSSLYSGATCVLVGLVWGATNPFVKRGALQVEEKKKARRSQPPSKAGRLATWLGEVLPYITTPSFLVPHLLNQSGSVLFVLLLGGANISVAVPLVNAASLAANAAADVLLGERYALRCLLPGLALVGAGLALCATSSAAA